MQYSQRGTTGMTRKRVANCFLSPEKSCRAPMSDVPIRLRGGTTRQAQPDIAVVALFE